MRTTSLAFVLAFSLAAVACDQGEEVTTSANAEAEAENAAVNAALGTGAPAAMPTDAAGFVAATAASDLFELESAKLAFEKSDDTDTRGIAQMLQREHTQSSADLKSAASEAGIPVAPALDAEKQAMLDQLKAASGADFDRTFFMQQRTAHQKAVMMLQNYGQSGDNEALKAFAAKVQSVVEHHLDRLNATPK